MVPKAGSWARPCGVSSEQLVWLGPVQPRAAHVPLSLLFSWTLCFERSRAAV